MIAEKRLLGYCGMYCGNCMGKTGVIADAARDFLDVLDKYEFEKTANRVFSEQLSGYDDLIDMLMFMENLRCSRCCREIDGGESQCLIRDCCVENGFTTCNSCPDFEACEKMDSILGGLHIEACRANLREINKIGIDNWLDHGKKHHYWDQDD